MQRKHPTSTSTAQPSIAGQVEQALAEGQVVVFTDGACTGNPGPGGYAAVLRYGQHRKEISGGYARTTNNRMELMAVIAALRALKRSSKVSVFSDSRYVVQAIEDGWAARWRRNGWIRNKAKDRAENPDLWGELLDLLAQHSVRFTWVRGHAGFAENERCDQLAVAAAHAPGLPADPGYPG
ncbi:MAG: ribonuclease HI [Chloroflexota bacterium]